MKSVPASPASNKLSAPPLPAVNRCRCFGCRAHVKRLEELNRLAIAEVDRLTRELDAQRAKIAA
jgi:hypothetical protein